MNISKILIIIILIPIVFYLGGESGYQAKFYLEGWKNRRAIERENKAIIDMFKNDTYGGSTPEETYNLFVDALKNEDVDLAVKYIVLDPDRRENYWKEFNGLKEEGRLGEYINGWPEWSGWAQVNSEENKLTIEYFWMLDSERIVNLPDGVGGYIEHTLPPGKYKRSIVFAKNINNVWKISNI